MAGDAVGGEASGAAGVEAGGVVGGEASGAAGAEEPERAATGSEVALAGVADLAVVGESVLARRMSELGLADEPRVVWRRPIDEDLSVGACEDGTLGLHLVRLAEVGLNAPVGWVDAATGAEVNPLGPYIVAGSVIGPVDTVVRVDPRSGYLVFTDQDHPGRANTVAIGRLSSEVAWMIVADRITKTLGYGWPLWVHDDHPDAEVLIPYATQFTDDFLWQLSDPLSGRPVWGVDWMEELEPPTGAGPDPTQVVLALLPGGTRGYDGLLGLSAEDGTPLWRLFYTTVGNRYRSRKHPIYAGKSDTCVVFAEVIDEMSCACGEVVVPGGFPERFCESCGQGFDYRVTIQVHNRATGGLLFARSWPDLNAPVTEVADVVDIRSEVLLTREGSFVRGYSLPEGRQLWSLTPPTGTTFHDSGCHPHSRWAWLRGVADASEGLFVHAATGRTLALPGAVHHTPDDRVVTHVDGELVCWALPGGGIG
ncbi:hypothetical protein KGQ20_05920 [Catenulispora sp. NF23]|uniref:hypothetical protein n=1 Tax=Catenulispora pinistramenti TaxID=2705254 RepID=UPI001BA5B6D6|nr:hypothetical protein [Catenulispora pinistramenti]MBS2532305.1 hypothetical protein [Catenulispora pinistramenti]